MEYWRRIAPVFEYRHPNQEIIYENSSNISVIRAFMVIITLIAIYVWVVPVNHNYYDVINAEQRQTLIDYYGYFQTNFSKSQFVEQSNITDEELRYYNRFWSPPDYIKQTNDQVFGIFTNFGVTNATVGKCNEDPQYDKILCDIKTDKPCVAGKQSINGVQTGKCVLIPPILQKYYQPERQHVCEIISWCPVVVWPPLKQEEGGILSQTNETFIAIESMVEFSQFGIQLKTETLPKLHCVYHPIDDPHCPFFQLIDIIKYSHDNDKTFEYISVQSGAIIDIKVDWNCGFLSQIGDCKPEFSFWRRDNKSDSPLRMWSEWDTTERTAETKLLIYGYRIQFEIFISGSVKHFNFYTVITSIFAYLSIFGLTVFTLLVSMFTSTDRDNRFLCNILRCRRLEYETIPDPD